MDFSVTFGRAVYGHLYILDRSKGQLLKQFQDVHPRGILAIQVYNNEICATADHWGSLKFNQIEVKNDTFEIAPINKDDTYPSVKYEPDGFGYTHMDHHGDKVLNLKIHQKPNRKSCHSDFT